VVAFTCLLQPDRPRRGQLTLFGAPEIHPDRLAATLARLTARLGPDRVGSPRTVDGHLPERADSVPFDPPPPPKLRQPSRRGRGLLAVRVVAAGRGGGDRRRGPERSRPVSSFRPGASPAFRAWCGSRPAVAAREGWGDQPQDRDYWDVELSDGGLYRLYRETASGDWFADGMYD
jgi:hypothetical protein